MSEGLIWTPHPVWPEPVAMGRTPEGKGVFRMSQFRDSVLRTEYRDVEMTAAEYGEFFRLREEKIRKAKADPLNYGFEPKHWLDADQLLLETKILCMFGGNRAGKSEYLMKRAMQLLASRENVNVLLLQNNDLSSKQGHQKTLWKYMPEEWRNLKKNQEGSIRYDPKNGFSENIFTTPLGGTCIFGNYGQDLEKYEGLEFDFIGPDENLPLKWYQGLLRGLATRDGSMVWGFTPIHGMTNAIAEVAGGARTRVSRPVDPDILEPNKRHVPDCPEGHMPYIAEKDDVRVIYFHSDLNPFGGYFALKKLYINSSREVRERRFYGFARRLARVEFPKFGAVNILTAERTEELIGKTPVTRYHVSDPAGSRNMFQIWVAVDERGRHFVYREWPDMETYGEWAVPSEDAKKWDGDPGPAQPSLGHGIVAYKQLILELEGNKLTANGWDMCGEPIYERLVDPRSGATATTAERDGGMSVIHRYEMEHFNEKGVLVGPPMILIPAPGFPETEGAGMDGKKEGIQGINDLLDYDESEGLTAIVNEPRLYVSKRCGNVIWAMQNYTGNDGGKAACKDPIDVLRYMATAELRYVSETAMRGRKGGYY